MIEEAVKMNPTIRRNIEEALTANARQSPPAQRVEAFPEANHRFARGRAVLSHWTIDGNG